MVNYNKNSYLIYSGKYSIYSAQSDTKKNYMCHRKPQQWTSRFLTTHLQGVSHNKFSSTLCISLGLYEDTHKLPRFQTLFFWILYSVDRASRYNLSK